MLVLEIAINGFWASNDLGLGVILFEVLSKETGISVRVVSTYDYEAI